MNNQESIREHHSIGIETDYTTIKGLVSSTGQSQYNFDSVILKELLDNSLDACEAVGTKPEILIGYEYKDGFGVWCIADNGSGLNTDTINKIIDFSTRTSDKAAYKSPSRGAQGNAFMTILGIPCALGKGYVLIESKGMRHKIEVKATSAIMLPTEHTTEPIPPSIGTVIKVIMKSDDDKSLNDEDNIRIWSQAFALFNPHIRVKNAYFENLELSAVNYNFDVKKNPVFYPINLDFKKITPADPTNAHSYTEDDFFTLASITGHQTKKTVYEFARTFKGATAKAKAKRIASEITGKLVADIYNDPDKITALHKAIKQETKPLKHAELGLVGKVNFLDRLQNTDEMRHWYEKIAGDINGFPYVFEILIAESSNNFDSLFFGINHSPCYGDFLSGILLPTNAFGLKHGILGLLSEVIDPDRHAVVCHLICANLTFTDKGKSNLDLPVQVKISIAEAVEKAAATLTKEQKRANSDYKKEQKNRIRQQKSEKISMKAAVSLVLNDAIKKATGDGLYPANVRALYYKVREFIQKYTTAELDYTYFSQNLLIEYWRENGRSPKIYNDPRGVLHHPHDDFQLPMGTFEVADYEFPDYLYNKILYIEKKGLCIPLQVAGLPKKYDMALIGGEGYACEAVRTLLDRAQTGEDYIIFVLHDADPDGYNIARTLKEETARMPDHNITVVDLGLSVESGLSMDLLGENKKRKKELPSTLELTELERDFFQGEEIAEKKWLGKIIELNAMSSEQLINYVDAGITRELNALNIPFKLIPNEDYLQNKAEDLRLEKLKKLIEGELLKKFDIEQMTDEIINSIDFEHKEFSSNVSDYLNLGQNELETWRMGLSGLIDSMIDEKKLPSIT